MERYRNNGGNSGVHSFEIGMDYIKIKFSGNFKTYKYSYQKAGRSHVEMMKKLARSGEGLNSYINNYVKYSYD